jgi:DNA-binding NarL/FixJ family response regulator
MTGTPDPRPNRGVVIIEDHALFAESLELTLSHQGYAVRRLPLPEEGGSLATVRAAALRANPRIALLDLDLGRFGDGAALIEPLSRAGTNVVVITASGDLGRWGGCIRLGARKVISKSRPLRETLATVRRLDQGLPVMTSEEVSTLVQHWRRYREEIEAKRELLARLTPRERAVLGEMQQGRTVREIARDSVVSEATVRTQVKSILGKFEVSSQLAAVGLANQVAQASS